MEGTAFEQASAVFGGKSAQGHSTPIHDGTYDDLSQSRARVHLGSTFQQMNGPKDKAPKGKLTVWQIYV